MKKIILASLLSSMALMSNSVSAASATKTFQASSTLTSKCFMEVGNISFGNMDYFQTVSNYTSGTMLKVLCSKGVSYTIEPLGGYTNGHNFILKGEAGNTDGVIVGLNKLVGGNRLAWNRSSNENKIIGTGTGVEQSWELGGASNRIGNLSLLTSEFTNTYNYEARPGNYSLTVTAQITY